MRIVPKYSQFGATTLFTREFIRSIFENKLSLAHDKYPVGHNFDLLQQMYCYQRNDVIERY